MKLTITKLYERRKIILDLFILRLYNDDALGEFQVL